MIFIITGCSSEKEQVIDEFKSETQDTYHVVIFSEGAPSQDFQQSVGSIDALWDNPNGEGNSLTYKMHYEGEESEPDYQAIFEIENYPKIVVFDNEDIVLQTNELDELQTFLEEQL